MTAGGTLLVLLSLMSAPSERLEPCPPTPNCVSTQARDPDRRMQPITYSGDLGRARRILLDLLAELPRVRVLSADQHLIRAEFTTLVFRFRDDVDFLLEAEEGVIHFRSASRTGHHDLGTNRRRMNRLTRLFQRADERGDVNP